MEHNRETADLSRIMYHVERLTAVQNSARDLTEDGRQIKVDAREEGFNPEVITLLSQIRSNHPHDDGEKFINLVVKYAQHAGIRFANIPENVDGGEKSSWPAQRGPLISQSTLYKIDENVLTDKTRIFLQLVLAMTVSGLFLWLLR